MDTTRNDRQAVYSYLMNCGLMLRITTGAIFNGMVNRDYVTVHQAPPKAVREIVNNFVMVGLDNGNLTIPLVPAPPAVAPYAEESSG